MTLIFDHNVFARAVKDFLEQEKDYGTARLIEEDCRNRMMEPDHYGLQAVAIAEQWFDSLSGLNLLIEKPGETYPSLIRCTEKEGKYFRWITQNGDRILPIPEEWKILAIQEVK